MVLADYTLLGIAHKGLRLSLSRTSDSLSDSVGMVVALFSSCHSILEFPLNEFLDRVLDFAATLTCPAVIYELLGTSTLKESERPRIKSIRTLHWWRSTGFFYITVHKKMCLDLFFSISISR